MDQSVQQALTIVEQGNFVAGGTKVENEGIFNPYHPSPAGQTLCGDHAYVFYQIPEHMHGLPLVFLHGHNQSGPSTWGMTPDGREGFQTMFLRRGHGVYLIDQPRRGEAGRATVSYTVSAAPDEQQMFNTFRLGMWPGFYEGVRFSMDPETLNQFFRRNTPNTAEFDLNVVSDGVAAALDRIGPCVLITHSQGGGVGWLTATKAPNVKAIVSYEPGSNFAFPEGEAPEPMHTCIPTDVLVPAQIPRENFMAFTKIPIIIYYGDNIPAEPVDDPGMDHWRVRLDMARLWVAKVNAYGGDATVVHLPEVGVTGNGHFPFAETNNVEVAELMAQFLRDKHLD